MNRFGARGLLFGAALLLGGATAQAATHVATIRQMAFELPADPIRVGDTIEWVNDDVVPHTATSEAGGFDAALGPGERLRVVVTRAGTFEITCRYHPTMRASLAVQ